jgi:hypothetical protein
VTESNVFQPLPTRDIRRCADRGVFDGEHMIERHLAPSLLRERLGVKFPGPTRQRQPSRSCSFTVPFRISEAVLPLRLLFYEFAVHFRQRGWKMTTNLAIERRPSARFAVYLCNLDDEPCQWVAEYGSIPDVLARKRRFEEVIKVQIGRQFLTWEEFVGWAVGQGYRA